MESSSKDDCSSYGEYSWNGTIFEHKDRRGDVDLLGGPCLDKAQEVDKAPRHCLHQSQTTIRGQAGGQDGKAPKPEWCKHPSAEAALSRDILSDAMSPRVSNISILPTLVLSVLAASCVGCSHKPPPVIAVIPETTAQEVWESAHAEATRVANLWGWDTFWNGASREDDLLRQIQIVDKEVDRGAAGIILAPDHAVALISPVREAVAKNIPVAIINSPLAASPKGDVVFVLNDDPETGRLAAERVLPHLNAKYDEVAILGVHPSILGTLTIADTITQTLQSEHQHVRVVEQRSIFSPSEAEDAADEVVREHPALAAIVALNVTQSRAAFGALARAKLSHRVVLIGCEQDFDLIYHVRNNEMDSVIAKDTGAMVREAMQWIHGRREGKATGATILIAPRLVTRANVDSPAIQRVLAVSGGAP